MNGYLRQSTASQSRLIGPFIDSTDFKTAVTGATIANTDVKLRANGTTLSNKNSGGGTHQANGMYSLTWDATDTANVGELAFSVVVSGALQVFGFYTVLEEAVYDALFAASAPGYVANAPVNVAQWNGSNVAAPDTAGYPKITIKVGTGTGEVNLSSGRVPVQFDFNKNVARTTVPFLMTTTDAAGVSSPATGKTVTCTRSIDGGAFGAGTLANVTEIANGWYCVDFGAGDLNGNNIVLRATAASCDDSFLAIQTFA